MVRSTWLAAAVTVAATMAACSTGGGTHPPLGAPTTPVTSAPATSAPTTSLAPTTTTTLAPACTNASVIASWTLSRRAADLVVVPILDATPAAIAVARAQGAGGILLLGSVPSPSILRAALAPLHRNGAGDIMVMTDEEGGEVQRLLPDVESIPWPRTMAQSMTTAAVTALARSLGAQMLALGVGVDLAPVVDIDGGASLSASDPDGPRSFSPDPAVASAYGLAFAAGLRQAGVLAVVKHFPGLGSATGNTDYGPAATQPISALRVGGLIPFERAVVAGAPAVMVANATVPGLTAEPASVSPAVIGTLLRDQLHFGGLVMTDSLSAGAISSAGYNVESAAAAAVGAGADMVLFGSTLTPADTAQLAPGPLARTTQSVVSAIVAAVGSGAIPISRLDQAVGDVTSAEGVNLCAG